MKENIVHFLTTDRAHEVLKNHGMVHTNPLVHFEFDRPIVGLHVHFQVVSPTSGTRPMKVTVRQTLMPNRSDNAVGPDTILLTPTSEVTSPVYSAWFDAAALAYDGRGVFYVEVDQRSTEAEVLNLAVMGVTA